MDEARFDKVNVEELVAFFNTLSAPVVPGGGNRLQPASKMTPKIAVQLQQKLQLAGQQQQEQDEYFRLEHLELKRRQALLEQQNVALQQQRATLAQMQQEMARLQQELGAAQTGTLSVFQLRERELRLQLEIDLHNLQLVQQAGAYSAAAAEQKQDEDDSLAEAEAARKQRELLASLVARMEMELQDEAFARALAEEERMQQQQRAMDEAASLREVLRIVKRDEARLAKYASSSSPSSPKAKPKPAPVARRHSFVRNFLHPGAPPPPAAAPTPPKPKLSMLVHNFLHPE